MPRRVGGRMLASGFESCVYSPPVPCADGRAQPADAVGKVLRQPALLVPTDTETRAAAVVHAIDPDGTFSLPLLGMCDVRLSDVRAADPAGRDRKSVV